MLASATEICMGPPGLAAPQESSEVPRSVRVILKVPPFSNL